MKNYFFTLGTKIVNTKNCKSRIVNVLVMLFILFGLTDAFGQTTETITTTGAGTWTAPCGVTSITVQAWGAGGSGGGTQANNTTGGGGGAGGSYASKVIAVTAGTTYNLYVAPANTGAQNQGVKGAGSWFGSNTNIFAEGGAGGAQPNGGTNAGGTGSTALSFGTTKTAGANGNGGSTTAGGAGGAGANGGGAGGALRNNTGGDGRDGQAPGGAGGGAFVNSNTNRAGGSGARGEIRITYTIVLPATPGNPTSNSPQCNPPGVTLTRNGTPPTGETWYWQTTATGTNTTNSGATFIATTSGTYYIRARNNTSGCWSTGSGSRTITVNSVPATVATPSPSNSTTGICYAGSEAISSIAWGTAAGATSYDVYFGAGSLPNTVTSNVATNTYNTGTLAANTTYYWRIVAKNACGDATTSATYTFTTNANPCYCASTSSTTLYYISNFTTTSGQTNINNTTNTQPSVAYSDFSAQSASNYIGASTSFSITHSATFGGAGVGVWIDWNNDFDFADANEQIALTTGWNYSPYTGVISIPAGTTNGNYRMRLIIDYNDATPSNICSDVITGETEDYTFSVVGTPEPINITPATTTTFCSGDSVTLTATSAAAYNYTWSPSTGLNTTSGATVIASPTSTTTYTVTGNNGTGMTNIQTFLVTINPTPTEVVISTTDATICANSIQTLTATGGTIINTTTASSGIVNLAIPDNNLSTGIVQTLSVSGIPTGAIITKIDVLFNITHSFASDVVINLEAPNGKIVNLVENEGSTGDNFTNTVITSNTSAASITGMTAPFTGTYQAELASNSTAGSPTPSITTQIFSDLFSTGNGNWKLRVYDDANLDTGVLVNCTLSITYEQANSIIWSPNTNLYTDVTCTTPYDGTSSALTVYAKPNAAITYTATATAGTCTKFDTVAFTTQSAIWNGTAWSSTPAANKSIVFAGNYTSTGTIEGCNCTVNSGNVTIATGNTLSLRDELTVNGGTITFQDKASLLQDNDNAINTGNIIYNRIATDFTTAAYDYVYWSSPTTNAVTAANGSYYWNTTYANANGTQGNWFAANNTPMATGVGYIMRDVFNKTFTGVPNNGIKTTTVQRGTITTGQNKDTDNWNLIGNPYPSAIDSHLFMFENTNIEGSIAVWTHNSSPSAANGNPFYGNYASNYHSNDYIIYNILGSQAGPHVFAGDIAAGQGFMVKLLETGNSTQTVEFNNSMRDGNNNSQFFRQEETNKAVNPNTINNLEMHRIWLEITNSNQQATRTLLGYVDGATNNQDRLFDATTSTSTDQKIYSLIGQNKFSIQGRELPFNDQDIVPLGFDSPSSGTYTIAINALDGLFLNQNVYLEDLTTNTIHNLSLSPYSFTTIAGSFTDRFRIRFNNQTLGNEDFTNENVVTVYANDAIHVTTANQTIKSVKVYDLLGRVLRTFNKVNATSFTSENMNKTQSALIVEVTLENGFTKTYKILY